MPRNRARILVLLVLSAALLGGVAGCGKKGPLYIPQEDTAPQH